MKARGGRAAPAAPHSGSPFVRALTEWMRKHSYSDERLAPLVGLDRKTIARLRLGRNKPRLRTVYLLLNLPGFTEELNTAEKGP